MQIGMVINALRRRHKLGHANMTDILYLPIPFLGSIYAQRDTVTTRRIKWEVLHGPNGREYLLCLGTLRVYLTPAHVVAVERHSESR